MPVLQSYQLTPCLICCICLTLGLLRSNVITGNPDPSISSFVICHSDMYLPVSAHGSICQHHSYLTKYLLIHYGARLSFAQTNYCNHAIMRSHQVTCMQGSEKAVPAHMEVVLLPFQRGGTFPGIFIFTETARMVRPVIHLASQAPVLIGSLEQHVLNIRCDRLWTSQ